MKEIRDIIDNMKNIYKLCTYILFLISLISSSLPFFREGNQETYFCTQILEFFFDRYSFRVPLKIPFLGGLVSRFPLSRFQESYMWQGFPGDWQISRLADEGTHQARINDLMQKGPMDILFAWAIHERMAVEWSGKLTHAVRD